MTYEERTNIESYLENLNNLVELKKALKRSLDRVEGDIEFSMFQIEEQTDDDIQVTLIDDIANKEKEDNENSK